MRKQGYLLALVGLALAALVATASAGRASRQAAGVSGSISIIAKWTGDEQKSFEAVLDGFKKANPDVDIKYTGAGDNTPQVVSTALQGGNPPDLASLPQPGLMKQFAQRGSLKTINFATSVIKANYAPSWVTLGTVNGRLYGLFFKASNKATVWYNVKSFRDAGVKTPTTFDQFLKVAKTLRASGTRAYSIGGANGWTLTDLFENIYLRQAGPAMYDKLALHKIKWTDKTVKSALRTMGRIVGDGNNIAGGISGALQTQFPTSVSNVFSESPKAAMVLEGDFVPGAVVGSNPLKPVTGYNVFTFPSLKPSTKTFVMGSGDVLVMLKDNEATRALIRYLASAQAQTIWAKRGGYTSPNKNVKASAYTDPLNRKTAIALGKAPVFRFDMSDLQPAEFGATDGQGMWKLFQDFMQNTRNVNGIASKLESAAAKAYKK
jgi:alpha-glucoside transport system substrate-binding protein